MCSYRQPLPEAAKARGVVALFDERVDLEVDGELWGRSVTPFAWRATPGARPRGGSTVVVSLTRARAAGSPLPRRVLADRRGPAALAGRSGAARTLWACSAGRRVGRRRLGAAPSSWSA